MDRPSAVEGRPPPQLCWSPWLSREAAGAGGSSTATRDCMIDEVVREETRPEAERRFGPVAG